MSAKPSPAEVDADDDDAPILPEHVAAARRTLRWHRAVTVALLTILGCGTAVIVGKRVMRSAAHDACVAEADALAAQAVQALARGAPIPGGRAHVGPKATVVVAGGRPLLVVDGALVAAGRVCTLD